MAQAVEFGDRLCASVAKLAIPVPGVSEFHVSVSVGIAEFASDDPDMDTLIRRADVALYRAKERGRNRVECEPEFVAPA